MIKKSDIMRRQMNRLKQRANQNLGRAEKTEVLNDELLQCEKRTEHIKHTCQNITKKLSGCLIGSGTDVEKRTKKLPHSVLSQSMGEMSTELGETTLLGSMLVKTSEACANIAQELTSHEMGLENLILIPFNSVLEESIPQIQSNKRRLVRLTLDLDSAKTRFHNASRQTGLGKGNFQEQAAKIDAIKEEQDDAQTKVEQCKDALVTDMLNLVSKESLLSRSLMDMVAAQAQYHRNALARLENMVPKMKETLDRDQHKPTFGTHLEEHLRLQDREIAAPIEVLITWLLELGIEEEGLFRLGGAQSKMKLLKAAFDANIELDLVDFEFQEHSIAAVLKLYLRELPAPLLTFDLYTDFIEAGSQKDPNQKKEALKKVVSRLPKAHFDNLKYLCRFLNLVADKSDKNKMTSSNLSLVIAPNMLWSEKDDLGTSLAAAPGIVDSFITHAEWYFPGAAAPAVTIPEPTSPNDEHLYHHHHLCPPRATASPPPPSPRAPSIHPLAHRPKPTLSRTTSRP
ncbi:rho GTPase-activating protein 17 isoform X4 [Strongylocentrotus purpuratus]|uniref:Uncharacterized protein n=1 Tax=Strongylocentrotus purpuratus TaxID=7668 RepID=A0A7M7NW53_STRPU|nr:rho GTPase-activating protein 17 isoform X4 [Strongylocentrotus purpuratus]